MILSSVVFANDNDTPYCNDPQREEEVRQKMESGFENMAIGITEITGGAVTVPGSPVSGGVLMGDGIRHIKNGLKDYEEAKRLIDEDRCEQNDMEARGMEPREHDISEH